MRKMKRTVMLLDEDDLEHLGLGYGKYGGRYNDSGYDDDGDNRTRNEKISDYARTRERDGHGRFLSKKERERMELEDYYYTPYKVVYKPLRHGPDHILVRQEELYWYQKVYVLFGYALGFIGIYGILISIWEGIKALIW